MIEKIESKQIKIPVIDYKGSKVKNTGTFDLITLFPEYMTYSWKVLIENPVQGEPDIPFRGKAIQYRHNISGFHAFWEQDKERYVLSIRITGDTPLAFVFEEYENAKNLQKTLHDWKSTGRVSNTES